MLTQIHLTEVFAEDEISGKTIVAPAGDLLNRCNKYMLQSYYDPTTCEQVYCIDEYPRYTITQHEADSVNHILCNMSKAERLLKYGIININRCVIVFDSEESAINFTLTHS